MMWRLWKGMKHPPNDHPVFLRVVDDVYDDALRLSRLLQNAFVHGQIWLWPLLFIIDMRLVCLMVLSSSLSGAIVTFRISSRIAAEQQRRTFDLLCMTPGGTLRTLWAISTGCLHREQSFEILNSQEAWIVRLGLFVPFIISGQLFLQRVLGSSGALTVYWGAGLAALLYIDYVQATVFAGVAGMLAAQRSAGIDPRLWGVAAFMTFQLGSYLLTLLVGLVVPSTLCVWLAHVGISVEISQMLLTVLAFYGIRAGIITWGWQRLMASTNAHLTDTDFLFRKPLSTVYALHNDAQTVART